MTSRRADVYASEETSPTSTNIEIRQKSRSEKEQIYRNQTEKKGNSIKAIENRWKVNQKPIFYNEIIIMKFRAFGKQSQEM